MLDRKGEFAKGSVSVENAPACYRAPGWPDPEFPRKIPKKYHSGLAEFTPKIPRKYQKSTSKIPKFAVFGISSVFSWGSKISTWRLFYRVGPSRGSVAGRGVLNVSDNVPVPRVSLIKHQFSGTKERNNCNTVPSLFLGALKDQGVLQGAAFTGVQVLREKRLISLHEKRVRRTAKMK